MAQGGRFRGEKDEYPDQGDRAKGEIDPEAPSPGKAVRKNTPESVLSLSLLFDSEGKVSSTHGGPAALVIPRTLPKQLMNIGRLLKGAT